jgi:Spy/CpxP family protein refolding chaperone
MTRFRSVVLAGTTVALLVVLRATTAEPTPAGKRADPWAVLGAKIGLSEQQQQQIRQIDGAFRSKAAQPRQQLLRLRQEQHEAVERVLTDDQRARLAQALHAVWDREWQAVAASLKLSGQQQQEIERIRQEYGQKFARLAKQGAHDAENFQELRAGFFAAIGKHLSDQQRAELPGVLHKEFGKWQNKNVQQQHYKALADNLGLSEAQRQQIAKLHGAYASKFEPPMEQLRRLHEEELEAVEKALTPEQRGKLRHFLEANGGERAAKSGGG